MVIVIYFFFRWTLEKIYYSDLFQKIVMKIKYILCQSWEAEKQVITLTVSWIGFFIDPSMTFVTSIETLNDLCKAAKPYQKENKEFVKILVKEFPGEPLVGGVICSSIFGLGITLAYLGTVPHWNSLNQLVYSNVLF